MKIKYTIQMEILSILFIEKIGGGKYMFYPVNINLDNMNILVVGGGKVALRKCENFSDFGKSVTIVSPIFEDGFSELENVKLIKREFEERDLNNINMAIIATNNRKLNAEISDMCRKRNIITNVVDDIDKSNFTVSSYVKRGNLLIGISTGGTSPSLSAKIKRELEEKYGEEYEEYTLILGKLRKIIIKKYEDKSERKNQLNRLVKLSLDELKKEYIKEKINDK